MFLWKIPDRYPEDLIGMYEGPAATDRFAFKQGVELPKGTTPIVRFECPSKALAGLDDLASNVMVPIVSERLQAVLRERCPDDVQLLETQVLTSDGEVPGYRLVNVTATVRAIDHEASEYKLIPGTNAIMKFRRLVLRPGSLGHHALARDAEYLSNLLVSEALGQELLELGLRQVGLYRPEDVRA